MNEEIVEGDIYLCEFPYTDFKQWKKRPVLVLKQLHGDDDFLVCMISSKVTRAIKNIDEIFEKDGLRGTGLKVSSVIRTQRLLVLEKSLLLGGIGKITPDRLGSIKNKTALWVNEKI